MYILQKRLVISSLWRLGSLLLAFGLKFMVHSCRWMKEMPKNSLFSLLIFFKSSLYMIGMISVNFRRLSLSWYCCRYRAYWMRRAASLRSVLTVSSRSLQILMSRLNYFSPSIGLEVPFWNCASCSFSNYSQPIFAAWFTLSSSLSSMKIFDFL